MNIRCLTVILFALITISVYAQHNPYIQAHNYILSHWDSTLEFHPNDSGDFIGMPKPYTTPSARGERLFKELFYWDTYFTNIGLISDGRIDLAQNNTDNILSLVKRFGKMPNGSNIHFLNRSQPPFLSMMVRDVYEKTHDDDWLKNAVSILEIEYRFWMTERLSPCGLNHYGSSANSKEKMQMLHVATIRFKDSSFLTGLDENNKLLLGEHLIAECESGWDFTPRFSGRCMDYCPVDLNSNLYLYEKNFAWFYRQLHLKEFSSKWEEKAESRKSLIYKYCYNADRGIFTDYNFILNIPSPLVTAASFYPFFSGVTNKKDSKILKNTLLELNGIYGVLTTEFINLNHTYQWSSENIWPPLQAVAFMALEKSGRKKEAALLGKLFLGLVESNFEKTGKLWEKYNSADGSSHSLNEYEQTAFLGWTAGVFEYFFQKK